MKKVVSLAVFSLLVSSGILSNAIAGPNSLGVFFEPQGTTNCAPGPAQFEILTAYLLIVNPGASGEVAGWEGQLLINPPTFPAGITMDIGPEALNVFSAPAFNVGFTLAAPRTGNPVTLLTITTFYLGGQISFGVGPTDPSSTQGISPCFVDAVDNTLLIPLTPSSNVLWPFTPAETFGGVVPHPTHSYLVAGVGGATCPTGIEPSSWGSVKALYK